MQRRDSRQEARELQEEFLQKAKQELDAFQRSASSGMHCLALTSSQGDMQPSSRPSLEDAVPSLDIDQQPDPLSHGPLRTTLQKRLSRYQGEIRSRLTQGAEPLVLGFRQS